MSNLWKQIGLFLLMMVFTVGCHKPDVPDDSGDDHGEDLEIHEYVDLGLPSGTLWATCNVGADTPEAFGDYYSWGETEPKEVYDWGSYQYGIFADERYTFTKYCTDSVYGLNGFVDSLAILEPVDDAATACWGADWRTPTIEEWEELFGHTSNEWTAQNGVNGWRFTASNGNSIFLPAAGYWWDGEFNGADLGIYWSVSLNIEFPYRAWGFHFNSYQCHLCGSSDRNRGQTIRAVCSEK